MTQSRSSDADVSVVIVNYRTPDLTAQAVQSVKDHAGPEGIRARIYVVDNGSGDGSTEAIRTAHPDITVLDAGGNVGFAAGNNVALRRVDTPYVMLLNSDAFLQAGALRRLVDLMEANPKVGVVGPRVLNPDGTDQDYPFRFPSILEMIRRAVAGAQFPARGRDPHEPITLPRIHGCCLMTRKAVLDAVGLLDERFWMYDEDVDWCLRAGAAGWVLWLVPDATVIHLGGQTSGRSPSGRRAEKTVRKFNPLMTYELRKSRYILYRKHRGPLALAALKVLTDATLLAAGAVAAVRALVRPDTRPQAWDRLKAYAAIMGLNPFRMRI
ncbi:MAG TPA: glycosyltransferase family 2 protein [Alphaproteobacteria bacterium]|nr:glycosyltransferase family 2 protein [Alphaproteobacteria bacterium]